MTYRVWSDKNATEALQVGNAVGACQEDSLIMLVDPSTAYDRQAETILHEALHAVWTQTYMDIVYPDGDADSEGEKMISELAPRVLSLLRDNSWLVRFLLEEKK